MDRQKVVDLYYGGGKYTGLKEKLNYPRLRIHPLFKGVSDNPTNKNFLINEVVRLYYRNKRNPELRIKEDLEDPNEQSVIGVIDGIFEAFDKNSISETWMYGLIAKYVAGKKEVPPREDYSGVLNSDGTQFNPNFRPEVVYDPGESASSASQPVIEGRKTVKVKKKTPEPEAKPESQPLTKEKLFNNWFNERMKMKFDEYPDLQIDTGDKLLQKIQDFKKTFNFGAGKAALNGFCKDEIREFANSLKPTGETRNFGNWTGFSINHFFDNVEIVNEKIPITSNIYETQRDAGQARSASASREPSRAPSGPTTRSQSKQASEAPSAAESKKVSPEKPKEPEKTLDMDALLKSPKLQPKINPKKSTGLSKESANRKLEQEEQPEINPKKSSGLSQETIERKLKRDEQQRKEQEEQQRKEQEKAEARKKNDEEAKRIREANRSIMPLNYDKKYGDYIAILKLEWNKKLQIFYAKRYPSAKEFIDLMKEFLQSSSVPEIFKTREFNLVEKGASLNNPYDHNFMNNAFLIPLPDESNPENYYKDELVLNLQSLVSNKVFIRPEKIDAFIVYIMKISKPAEIERKQKELKQVVSSAAELDKPKKDFRSAVFKDIEEKAKEKETKTRKAVIDAEEKRTKETEEKIKARFEEERKEKELLQKAKQAAIDREKTENDRKEETDFANTPLLKRYLYNKQEDSYRFVPRKVLDEILIYPKDQEQLKNNFLRQMHGEFKKVLKVLGYKDEKDRFGFNNNDLDIVDDLEERIYFFNQVYYAVFDEINSATDISVTNKVYNLSNLKLDIIENINKYALDYSRGRFGDTSSLLAEKIAKGEILESDISDFYGQAKKIPEGESFQLGEGIIENTQFYWNNDIEVYFDEDAQKVDDIAKGKLTDDEVFLFSDVLSNQSYMKLWSIELSVRIDLLFEESINPNVTKPYSKEQYETTGLNVNLYLDVKATKMFIRAIYDLYNVLEDESISPDVCIFQINKYRKALDQIEDHQLGYYVGDDLNVSDIILSPLDVSNIDVPTISTKKTLRLLPKPKISKKYLFIIWLDKEKTKYVGITKN